VRSTIGHGIQISQQWITQAADRFDEDEKIAVHSAQRTLVGPSSTASSRLRLRSDGKCGPAWRASRTLVVYEAGPRGFGLARRLNAAGYSCEVVAPWRIACSPIDQQISTDRRDALLLGRESRAGNLVPVVIPDERDEAMRDMFVPIASALRTSRPE
jgi:transposase